MAASCLVGGGIKICGAENVANLEEKASLSDNSTRNETMKLTFLQLIPKRPHFLLVDSENIVIDVHISLHMALQAH